MNSIISFSGFCFLSLFPCFSLKVCLSAPVKDTCLGRKDREQIRYWMKNRDVKSLWVNSVINCLACDCLSLSWWLRSKASLDNNWGLEALLVNLLSSRFLNYAKSRGINYLFCSSQTAFHDSFLKDRNHSSFCRESQTEKNRYTERTVFLLLRHTKQFAGEKNEKNMTGTGRELSLMPVSKQEKEDKLRQQESQVKLTNSRQTREKWKERRKKKREKWK